jgi:superoxide reductase
MKFYMSENYSNIITKLTSDGAPILVGGKELTLIQPGAIDAAVEKHVPAVKVEGKVVSVNVGEVNHPMTAEHYIPWVALETSHGAQVRWLQPTDAPSVSFLLAEGEEAKVVYAYCNLHGLWQKEL